MPKKSIISLVFFILFNFKIKLKDDMPCICFHPPLAGTRALFHIQSALTSSLFHYHSYITPNPFGDWTDVYDYPKARWWAIVTAPEVTVNGERG